MANQIFIDNHKVLSSAIPAAPRRVHPVNDSATGFKYVTDPMMSVVIIASPMLASVTRCHLCIERSVSTELTVDDVCFVIKSSLSMLGRCGRNLKLAQLKI